MSWLPPPIVSMCWCVKMAVLLRVLGGDGGDAHDAPMRANDQNESDIVMLQDQPMNAIVARTARDALLSVYSCVDQGLRFERTGWTKQSL